MSGKAWWIVDIGGRKMHVYCEERNAIGIAFSRYSQEHGESGKPTPNDGHVYSMGKGDYFRPWQAARA